MPIVPTLIRVPRGSVGEGAAMPQFVPRPGASSALASGEPSIRTSAPAATALANSPAAAHAPVGDDRHVPPGLREERVACRRHVADRGHLRDAESQHLACRARGSRPDADEDRCRALLHQRERRLGIRRIADRDRDRHVAREVLERQRVVAGREMASARDLALDEEQVGAVLARRTDRTGEPRRASRTPRPSSLSRGSRRVGPR